MATRSKPTNIVADRARRVLTITWDDGRDSYYSFAGLRAVCPCVLCQGGHANMGQPTDKLLLRRAQDDALNLEAITPIGSYAVQFRWNDGHDSGIYTWDYLYEAGLE